MKPSAAKEALKTTLKADTPTHLWGAPGIGKSDIVRQSASALDLELRDIRASQLDAVDLRGIPHVNEDGRTHWATPSFMPAESDGAGILFLDELTSAPPLVQAACYQLILDRKLGEYTLPPTWRIIAAGNRETDRGVTHRMPTPLANRFVHLDLEPDLNDWTRWALDTGLDIRLIAFIKFRPNLLFAFDPKKTDEKAFPTPRSWETISRLLTADPPNGSLYDLAAGTVGQAAAAEFHGFLQIYRDLPDPIQVIQDPAAAPVPEQPAAMYAITQALAGLASENTLQNVTRYFSRMPAEFGVMGVTDAIRQHPELTSTRAYIQWSADNSEVLI